MKKNRAYLRVTCTADMNWESKIDHAMKGLCLTKTFDERNDDYGESLAHIFIVFMCRNPELGFKQRIRYRKADRVFYMDIMLHLPDVVRMSHAERRRLLADALLQQVPERLRRYKFRAFDYERFEADWTQDVTSQLLGADADRFDHHCLPQVSCLEGTKQQREASAEGTSSNHESAEL